MYSLVVRPAMALINPSNVCKHERVLGDGSRHTPLKQRDLEGIVHNEAGKHGVCKDLNGLDPTSGWKRIKM
jgi:hypothetical protein